MAGQDRKEYVPQNKGIRKPQNLLDCNLLSPNGNPNGQNGNLQTPMISARIEFGKARYESVLFLFFPDDTNPF